MKTGLFAAAVLVAATACKEDLTPFTTQWTGLEKQWTDTVTGLEGKVAEIKTKAGAEPAEAVKTAIGAAEASVASGKEGLAKAKASFDEAIKSGKSATVKPAIEKATADMTALVAKIDGDVAGAAKAVDEAQAAAAAAAAEMAAKMEPFNKVAKEGGSLDLTDINFKDGTAELADDAGAAIDRLVAFSNLCADLKYELVGHVAKGAKAKDDQKLSEERAKAVQAAVVAKGVDAAKITKASGKGGSEPKITVAVSAVCK
ncbi:OmpA family protein [Myxococcota bacterium]|nr:OmpA family protein [Myxococcota bacterium]